MPKFSPGTTVSLVVEVEEVYDVDLECGTPIPAANLHCDRDLVLTGAQGPRGGCLFTPSRLPVDADGGFSVQLPGSQCFAGRLAISVRAPQVTVDPARCVGEQVPAPGAAAVELDRLTVDYLPPEEPSTGSSDTGSTG